MLNTRLIITPLSNPIALTLSSTIDQATVLDNMSGAFQLLGTPIQITTSTIPDTISYTLKMTYTDQQVTAAGVDENSLMIQYWDPVTKAWTAITPSIVDPDENVVQATLTHFSIFALTGSIAPLWTQLWFLVVLATSAGISLSVVLAIMRRRNSSMATPSRLPRFEFNMSLLIQQV